MPRPLGQLLTAMVTPFAADGSVDAEAAAALARDLVEEGCDGIVACATTGESPTLSDAEKLGVFEAVSAAVGDRACVLANTGSYDTRHSAELTRRALATGVDGFLVVTPYYNKPPAAGIVAHFETIADAADGRPVMAYNIPQRCVLNLEPPLLRRLGEIANVVAVKQATPDLDQARAIVEQTGLALYAGNDDLLLPFLELGGAGGVCVASNVAARLMREQIERFRSGDVDGARALEPGLRRLYAALSVTTNPIPIKAALELTGRHVGGLRLPLVEASAGERETVRAALAALPMPAVH